MEKLAEILWGVPMMVFLLIVGAVMTLRTNFVQMRKLSASFRQVGKSLQSADRSGFRAVCTALAATVGTGNIAGVAGAIALGGPGAVFWMWIAAFLGMATKYAEVVLAKKYAKDGKGGPMYYILLGMGEEYRWLAAVFAFSAVLASFGMGNMTQVNTIASAVTMAVPAIEPRVTALATGVIAAVLVGLVTIGGVGRIGQVTEKLVPLMAGTYIVSMLAVILLHWENLGQVLTDIFLGAFSPKAVLGGGVGIGLRQAVRWGVSRGVFSNEAGLGSAPIAHAGSGLGGEEQGLLGIFEVFFDTIVLCSLTAFAMLSCGTDIAYGTAAGAELAIEALETVFGSWAAGISAAILSLLALATVISWQLYGLRCAEYLWGNVGAKGYSLCYAAAAVLGATMKLSHVWALADVCSGFMCLPNLIALLHLGKNLNAPENDPPAYLQIGRCFAIMWKRSEIMKKLFSLNGPVFRFFSTLGKLILLSLCWLVCCIPILTVGASTAAMFRVAFDLCREKEVGIVKAFFKAFVKKFKLGTLCWLVTVAAAAVLYCIPRLAAMLGIPILVTLTVSATTALYLIFWLILACVFPVAAYFDSTLKKTVKNALIIAVHHRKQSIGSALFLAIPLIVFLIDSVVFAYACGIWLLIFPGVWAYFTACRFAPIFEEYANRKKEKEEETKNETF